jgi:hypothetical protein
MSIASSFRSIKLNPQLYEPPHRSWGLLYQGTHRLLITQTCSRSYRILKVKFRTIICAQCHREATLCVAGITLAELPFREECHAQMLR